MSVCQRHLKGKHPRSHQESLERSRNKLHKISRDEFETIYISSRIEKKNGAAAASQLALNHLVVRAELQTAIKLDHGKENFGDEIKRLEQSLTEQEQRFTPNLPVGSVQKLVGLLYKPLVPKVGESASIKLPVPMMMGALSQAQRTANKMHVKKSELSTSMVIIRLNNELEKVLAGGSRRL